MGGLRRPASQADALDTLRERSAQSKAQRAHHAGAAGGEDERDLRGGHERLGHRQRGDLNPRDDALCTGEGWGGERFQVVLEG